MEQTKHLSEQEIAQCAEAINKNTYRELDQAIRNHISECDDCAHEVTMITSILEEEEALTTKIDAAFTHNNTSKKAINFNLIIPALIAASLVLFFGLKLVVNNNNDLKNNISQTLASDTVKTIQPEKQIPEPKAQKQKSSEKEQKQEKKSESPIKIIKSENNNLLAYSPNNQMEKLVERFDHAAMRGNEIEIKSPILIESKIGQCILSWVNTDNQLLIVEFYNNKGEKLFENETKLNSFQPEQLNKPGLYYWKLINQDFDLLFCGKIKLN